MKAKLGILCVVMGLGMLAAALGLFLSNDREQQLAQASVDTVMPQLVKAIHVRHEEPKAQPLAAVEEMPQIVPATRPRKTEMPVVAIDGEDYVGFVAIPTLGLELPVTAKWSYTKLKYTPCRFTGDLYSDDLVIMAHNYDRHFGGLKDLRVGDSVTFTDMDGETVAYVVAAKDILDPNAVEEMTAGEYDLTLFTCTYGGEKRVTVRCDRVDE